MLNSLANSYTFDLITTGKIFDQWSEVISETVYAQNIRCHFRTRTEMVQIGWLAQYEVVNKGKIIYAGTPLATLWDICDVKMSGASVGRFLVEGVNENRFANWNIDSYILFWRLIQ